MKKGRTSEKETPKGWVLQNPRREALVRTPCDTAQFREMLHNSFPVFSACPKNWMSLWPACFYLHHRDLFPKEKPTAPHKAQNRLGCVLTYQPWSRRESRPKKESLCTKAQTRPTDHQHCSSTSENITCDM